MWQGTFSARYGSAEFEVCAAKSNDTLARWTFAAGHALRGIGENIEVNLD